VALAGAGLALVLAAGCGGGSDEAVTTTAAAAPAPAQGGAPQSGIERRLSDADYHVVRNAAPRGQLSLTTGAKQMIVYIVRFRTAREAAVQARGVAATARKNPRQVVARRVGRTVYSAVAAESPEATADPAPLAELIKTAEGRRAKAIRISPR
jgi:hypothetical protein